MQQMITGVTVLTVLILVLGIVYKFFIDRAKSYTKMPKLIFLIFLLIRWIKRTTLALLGPRYRFAIPFFIYLVFYFLGSSLVGMLGFKSIATFMSVPLIVAGVVLVGTIISGIVSKRGRFCSDYCIWIKIRGKKIFPIFDVLKVMGELGKVVSLGLRLWGNYFAGALILFIVHYSLGNMVKGLGLSGSITYSLFAFPLHLYFDVVDGALHSVIFLLLTMTYWMMAKHTERTH